MDSAPRTMSEPQALALLLPQMLDTDQSGTLDVNDQASVRHCFLLTFHCLFTASI